MNIENIDAGDIATAGVALLGGGAAVVCAPAIGAALSALGLGVGAGSLSGAAASSSGLAALGGGSLASGGLGIAGGTGALGIAGSAVGAAAEKAGVAAYEKFAEYLPSESSVSDVLSSVFPQPTIADEIGKMVQSGSSSVYEKIDAITSPFPSDLSNLTHVGSSSLTAASLSLAATVLPEMVSGVLAAIEGKKTVLEVAESIGRKLKTHGLQVGTEAFVKSGLSGVLAATPAFDPTGAVLVVTLSIDIGRHALALRNGEIDLEEFKKRSQKSVVEKGGTILLTSGAMILVGPAGLIVPIIVSTLIANAKLRKQIASAMESVFLDAEEMIARQIGAINKLNQIAEFAHEAKTSTEQASASAKENINTFRDTIDTLKKKLENMSEQDSNRMGDKA